MDVTQLGREMMPTGRAQTDCFENVLNPVIDWDRVRSSD